MIKVFLFFSFLALAVKTNESKHVVNIQVFQGQMKNTVLYNFVALGAVGMEHQNSVPSPCNF